jgi:TM2 domain-containing membrane protein YozV
MLCHLQKLAHGRMLGQTYSDSPDTVRQILTEQGLRTAMERLEALKQDAITSEDHGKYRMSENGEWQVRKAINSGLATRNVYYPCLSDDPDEFFRLAFLGGIIGAHKYKSGQVMQGIFYTLTFGLCGVLYLCDLLAMICGNYCVQNNLYVSDATNGYHIVKRVQKRYLRALDNKRAAVMLFLLAFFIAVLAVGLIYRPLVALVGQALSGLATSAAQGFLQNKL